MERRLGERVSSVMVLVWALMPASRARAQSRPDEPAPPAYPPPAAAPAPAPYPPPQPGYPPAQPDYPPPAQPGYPPPAQPGYPPPWQAAPYPPQVSAAEPVAVEPRFGDRGQMVLTGGFGSINSSDNFTNISIFPAIDFFVTNHFSIGGGVRLTYIKNQGASAVQQQEGVLFQIGFDVPLGGRVSLWPRLLNGVIRVEHVTNYVTSELQVPLLVHAAPHFFIGAGPFVSTSRLINPSTGANSNAAANRGLTTFVGGWM